MTEIKYPIGAFAPGHYTNKCMDCQVEFMGDKYAKQCEPCAINSTNEQNRELLFELRKCRAVITKLKEVQGLLNSLEIEETKNKYE